eukprot:6214812-Pleurochrysis_carterae.AAC.3
MGRASARVRDFSEGMKGLKRLQLVQAARRCGNAQMCLVVAVHAKTATSIASVQIVVQPGA